MRCPDIDIVISATRGTEIDPSLHAHLRTCPDCTKEFEVLLRIDAALHSFEPVSPQLVERVMESLPAGRGTSHPGEYAGGFDRGHSTLTFIMATSTVAVVSVFTGGEASPSLILFATLMGFLAARLEPRVLKL